jgi:hypothetical protein
MSVESSVAATRRTAMRYRTLGRTGIQTSPYALGAMNFGAMGNPDDAIRIIHKALDAGINLIDTADVYSLGESEIVPPSTDVGQLQMAYNPPAVTNLALRRRSIEERTAAYKRVDGTLSAFALDRRRSTFPGVIVDFVDDMSSTHQGRV